MEGKMCRPLSDTTTNHLVYQPLPNDTQYLRLLELSPDREANISCSMTTHRLDDVVDQFDAISYVWGQPGRTAIVTVNGRSLSVTDNAHYALLQMCRHHTRRRVREHRHISQRYWIDSICINQNDNEEKAAQVACMHQIFRSAHGIAACLGPGTLQLQRQLQSYLIMDKVPLWRACHRLRKERKMQDSLDELTYFHRLWIVQEIILARRVRFFVGINGVYNLDDFNFTASMNAIDDHDGLSTPYKILAIRNHLLAGESPPLAHLLNRFVGSDCALLHDRLYGLLGLSAAVGLLTVDYDQSLWSLIGDLLQLCIDHPDAVYEHPGQLRRAAFRLLAIFMYEPAFSEDVMQFLRARLTVVISRPDPRQLRDSGPCKVFLMDPDAGPPFLVTDRDVTAMLIATIRVPSLNDPTTLSYKACLGSNSSLHGHRNQSSNRRSAIWRWPADIMPGDLVLASIGLNTYGAVRAVARPRSDRNERLDLIGWATCDDYYQLAEAAGLPSSSDSLDHSWNECPCQLREADLRYRLVLARDDWLNLLLLYPHGLSKDILGSLDESTRLAAFPITTSARTSYVEVVRTTKIYAKGKQES